MTTAVKRMLAKQGQDASTRRHAWRRELIASTHAKKLRLAASTARSAPCPHCGHRGHDGFVCLQAYGEVVDERDNYVDAKTCRCGGDFVA